MALAVASWTDGTIVTSGTSCSVAAPGTLDAGDLLIGGVYIFNITTPTEPGAYSLINQTTGGSFQVRSLARIADDTSTDDYRASWAGSTYGHAGLLRITGADPVRPINVVGADNTGTSRTVIARGITTTVDGCLLVVAWSTANPATSTDPAGFTHQDSNSGCGILTGTQTRAGATGDISFAISVSDTWAAHMFAITPAAVAAIAPHRLALLGVG